MTRTAGYSVTKISNDEWLKRIEHLLEKGGNTVEEVFIESFEELGELIEAYQAGNEDEVLDETVDVMICTGALALKLYPESATDLSKEFYKARDIENNSTNVDNLLNCSKYLGLISKDFCDEDEDFQKFKLLFSSAFSIFIHMSNESHHLEGMIDNKISKWEKNIGLK